MKPQQRIPTVLILAGWLMLIFGPAVSGVLAGPAAQGGAPPLINYQGYLTDSGSQPLNGTVALKFGLYIASSGGSPLWEETHNSVSVSGGYFSLLLGSVIPLSAANFSGPARYLQVSVDTGSGFESLPRQQMAAVPYALQAVEAQNAWSLNGNSGTTPGSHFLGTTDAVSLTLVVNGSPALRLIPDATSPNLIGGYGGNSVTAGVYGSVIAGGGRDGSTHRVYDNYGTIGGGQGNAVGLDDSTLSNQENATVAGGSGNTASHPGATVGGGFYNVARGNSATVAGGSSNDSSGQSSIVGGGAFNVASAKYATIAGGGPVDSINPATTNNRVYDDYGTVGGGGGNVVGIDDGNSTNQTFATVSGGRDNSARNDYATVGGGRDNDAADLETTVGGGSSNTATKTAATVSGGSYNIANGSFATVGGGGWNSASTHEATVSGGYQNTASGVFATVGGGAHNLASAKYATIAGGGPSDPGNPHLTNNRAFDEYGTIAGGGGNVVGIDDGSSTNQAFATVGGGQDNTASGSAATVGGGERNTAGGDYAMVPGGRSNTAAGSYSFAAGQRAKANHDGAFVWADATIGDFSSADVNTFNVRAANGARISANTNDSGLAINNSGADGTALVAQNNGSGKNKATIRANNTQSSGGVTAYLTNDSTYATLHAYNGGAGEVLYLQNGGDVAGGGGGDFIKAVNEAQNDAQFRVASSGEVRSDIGFFTPSADFAEMLPAAAGLEPGDVLAIGPNGRLVRSSEAYQSTVAGVYSTRPGFVGGMPVEGNPEGQVPLAVVGIVPVKASAEGGPIQPGDLLTASATPGHAMKAKAGAPQGTVIGKALEPLAGETGLIVMLVILQ